MLSDHRQRLNTDCQYDCQVVVVGATVVRVVLVVVGATVVRVVLVVVGATVVRVVLVVVGATVVGVVVVVGATVVGVSFTFTLTTVGAVPLTLIPEGRLEPVMVPFSSTPACTGPVVVSQIAVAVGGDGKVCQTTTLEAPPEMRNHCRAAPEGWW